MNSIQARLDQQATALPDIATRFIDFADVNNPAAIMVCDRSARPIGYTLEQVAQAENRHLPPVFYAQISTALSKQALDVQLEPLVSELTSKDVADDPIMVIDDHMSRGGTKFAFINAVERAGLHNDILWTTVTGKGADLSLFPHSGPYAHIPWNGLPNIIGIDYIDGELVDRTTNESADFYRSIDRAVAQHALVQTMRQ